MEKEKGRAEHIGTWLGTGMGYFIVFTLVLHLFGWDLVKTDNYVPVSEYKELQYSYERIVEENEKLIEECAYFEEEMLYYKRALIDLGIDNYY